MCSVRILAVVTLLIAGCSATIGDKTYGGSLGYMTTTTCDPSMNIAVVTFHRLPPFTNTKDVPVIMCVSEVKCYPMEDLGEHSMQWQGMATEIPKDATFTAYEDLGQGKKGTKLEGVFDPFLMPYCTHYKTFGVQP